MEEGVKLFGVEAIRPFAALIQHDARLREDIDAFRPAVIGDVGGVVHVVEQSRYRQMQAKRARTGDVLSLVQGTRLGVEDVLRQVGLGLPAICRVRFPNVDDVEIGNISIGTIYLVQATCLPSEGRSGVAPEDENDRAQGVRIADADCPATVQA